MEKVKRQLHEAARAQESLSRSSFKNGVVRLKFGIAADGSVISLKILEAREDMLAERNMCLETIRTAGPFPPLTPAMQKDKNFRRIVVHFWFQ